MSTYSNLVEIQVVQAAIVAPSVASVDLVVPFGCFA